MKPIPGFTCYQITKDGRIFGKFGNEMKQSSDKDGYKRITLGYDSGGRRSVYVHRLVAMTYIDNPDNKPEVNHINNIRHDNRKENLQWVTRQENNDHALNQGRHIHGEKSIHAKLKETEVRKIRKLNHYGMRTVWELADEFKLTVGQIRKILTRKHWKHTHKDAA